MNALLPHVLLPAVLLVSLPLAAFAAESSKPSNASECIALGANRDIRPSSTEREVLLRDGDNHYRVHLQKRCLGAAASASYVFFTPSTPERICGDARSTLKTDSNHCTVTRIEPIDAATFRRLAQQGR
ncbi:hypothetical protein U0039_11920 [Stenotrophomonas maltophilia]|uniref:hypothetical protein n=1 Tax=Stenotrophomonas maltophilia TaxID=40324 RepID=UPI0004686211|nr:hypothetical protein [Stenotrophomonas maltophilia]OMP41296.1 hypothetical protein BMR86_02765 [Stenotrophomonas sp. KAs 5-3]AIL09014.1 hypothetical protein DP16_2331 [Stenotrophomonas maltophilia]MBH1578665.1 hypothetical protein [Stenotrophomonas maltophilia]OOD13313.1 hypothetical protein BWP19_13305 [Stenotrophomonas maltophilia]QQA84794.1 hypothetical protein I6I01_10520 [Stenotrophomonas maltophilia]